METKEAYGFIYITTNMINGKRYIGQRRFYKNWEEYLGSGKLIIRAINKYGKENFERDVVAIAYSKEELDKLEIDFIKNYDATKSNNFYNIASGGWTNNFIGKPDDEMNDFKRRMSEMNKGKNSFWYGKHHTEETKEKIRSKKLGSHIHTEEFKKYLSDINSGEKHPQYGKHKNKDTIYKISKSKSKQLICTTTDKIFNLVSEALKEYNIKSNHISDCCKGKRNFCGKLEDGTKLEWMYYEDYLEQIKRVS
ncbi:hypothetical protein FDB42_13610 [Clostridium botulinum]|nr:hypothetical protein [Clostridium botulinum]